MQDCFKLHKSKETMRPKPTDKSIRYVIRQLEKDAGLVAKEMHVTRRRVQRLWAEYLKTGVTHQQRQADQPRSASSQSA